MYNYYPQNKRQLILINSKFTGKRNGCQNVWLIYLYNWWQNHGRLKSKRVPCRIIVKYVAVKNGCGHMSLTRKYHKSA